MPSDFANSLDSVTVDPLVRSGAPVIPGTRFPVAQLLLEVAEGKGSLETICSEYGLVLRDVRAIFAEIGTAFIKA